MQIKTAASLARRVSGGTKPAPTESRRVSTSSAAYAPSQPRHASASSASSGPTSHASPPVDSEPDGNHDDEQLEPEDVPIPVNRAPKGAAQAHSRPQPQPQSRGASAATSTHAQPRPSSSSSAGATRAPSPPAKLDENGAEDDVEEEDDETVAPVPSRRKSVSSRRVPSSEPEDAHDMDNDNDDDDVPLTKLSRRSVPIAEASADEADEGDDQDAMDGRLNSNGKRKAPAPAAHTSTKKPKTAEATGRVTRNSPVKAATSKTQLIQRTLHDLTADRRRGKSPAERPQPNGIIIQGRHLHIPDTIYHGFQYSRTQVEKSLGRAERLVFPPDGSTGHKLPPNNMPYKVLKALIQAWTPGDYDIAPLAELIRIAIPDRDIPPTLAAEIKPLVKSKNQ